MKKISLFEIFKIFFIIGAQLLGGGYVILPLLKKYIVEEREWISEEDLINYFTLSQCIPGIIAGNISIFTGYKLRKVLGAITSITAVILPSFIAIIIIATLLTSAIENPIILNAFWGIRISVIILVILTIRDMWGKSVNSIFTYILYFLILFSMIFVKVSPALIIIISAVITVIYPKIVWRKNA